MRASKKYTFEKEFFIFLFKYPIFKILNKYFLINSKRLI